MALASLFQLRAKPLGLSLALACFDLTELQILSPLQSVLSDVEPAYWESMRHISENLLSRHFGSEQGIELEYFLHSIPDYSYMYNNVPQAQRTKFVVVIYLLTQGIQE